MPDVKTYQPTGLFPDKATKIAFRVAAARVIATQMNCFNTADEPVMTDLNPVTEIDLLMFDYDAETSQSGVDMQVEVGAFRYPDRMVNITERLEAIKEALVDLLPEGRKQLSLTFTPIEAAHWVFTE